MKAKQSSLANGNVPQMRAEWIAHVTDLVNRVDGWCKQQGWATRRASKMIEDVDIGVYKVPMLLIQQWDVQLLLEPIARFVGGADGRVDLYRMPQYDEVAMILRKRDTWRLRYPLARGNGTMGRTGERLRAFDKSNFVEVVKTMLAENAQA